MRRSSEARAFASKFVLFAGGAGALGVILLILDGRGDKLLPLLVAWGASFVIILSGYLANQWAFTRSHKVFLSTLLGGMALRILLLVGLILLIYFKQWVPVFWFLIFLAGYYFLFQLVEVVVINRQLKAKINRVQP